MKKELAELRKEYKKEVIRANRAEKIVLAQAKLLRGYLDIFRELNKDRELLRKIKDEIHNRERQQRPLPSEARGS